VLFDHSAATLPAAAINAYGTSYVGPALTDGNNWYAHVRTVDARGQLVGNGPFTWPFYIDHHTATNPTSIIGPVCSTPGVWSSLNTIGVGWAGPVMGRQRHQRLCVYVDNCGQHHSTHFDL